MAFKTGPTANYAAAKVQLQNVKGDTLTVLGTTSEVKDRQHGRLRAGRTAAAAPTVQRPTTTGSWFIACNSPAPTTAKRRGPAGAMNVSGTGQQQRLAALRLG